jgi:hypothetical protein
MKFIMDQTGIFAIEILKIRTGNQYYSFYLTLLSDTTSIAFKGEVPLFLSQYKNLALYILLFLLS